MRILAYVRVCVCVCALYSMLRFFSELTVLIGPVYISHQTFMYKQMLTFVFLIKIGNHDVRVDNIVCMFFIGLLSLSLSSSSSSLSALYQSVR